MLYRKIEKILDEYYLDDNAKILIINGARQIGKTFIIRETARKRYKNYIEINLKEDFDGDKRFSNIKKIEDFYLQIGAEYGNSLNSKADTIIFLDEIQVYPHLLTMLKSLKQDDKYKYITSGSLLGITLKHTFIPMGSIQEVKMYPLDFEEFLIANGVNKDVIDHLKGCFNNKKTINESLHLTILDLFKRYLICGGLPEAVNEFIKSKNIAKVRDIQKQIYSFYKDDASQYDKQHNLKIRMIYDYLTSYMENKVNRVCFKKIEDNAHASLIRYEDEFDYLISSGCSLASKAIADPKFPLVESMSKKLIKLYYNDVGILSGLLFKNEIQPILFKDKAINLGSVYETVCAMELVAHGHELYYFDSKKVGEVDFLINDYKSLNVLPIEIKSGNNQNNFRAIPKLLEKPYYSKKGLIFSNKREIEEKNNLIYFPIYMIMFV